MLEDRLAELILDGNVFTADDVTDEGRVAVDGGHRPNGRQSSIGAHFQLWRRRGWIEPTGHVIRSKAEHRKGGMIRVWAATPEGRHWAFNYRDGRFPGTWL